MIITILEVSAASFLALGIIIMIFDIEYDDKKADQNDVISK